eukprot:15357707-Ditylum_brightwellii.AAC.1
MGRGEHRWGKYWNYTHCGDACSLAVSTAALPISWIKGSMTELPKVLYRTMKATFLFCKTYLKHPRSGALKWILTADA